MINKLISELYTKNIPMKVYNKVKKKLNSIEDVEDYKQEMYLILLETPEDKILDLHKQGKLDDYFARICINQLVNYRSNLHKTLQTNWIKVNFEDYEGETDKQ